MGIDQCRPIELPVVEDPFGDLAFAEAERHVPFPIARAFFVSGVPAVAVRGGHAHRELEQALFCVHGGLRITVDDGANQASFTLSEPRTGLYLPSLVWHDMDLFEPETAYLVLASAPYEESDYIRDREEFRRLAAAPV